MNFYDRLRGITPRPHYRHCPTCGRATACTCGVWHEDHAARCVSCMFDRTRRRDMVPLHERDLRFVPKRPFIAPF